MKFSKFWFRDSERGQAILELALVLPFLVMVLVAVSDLGRAMTRYSAHVGIARDAANLGSRIINLADTSITTTGNQIQQINPLEAGHLLMHLRARTLLTLRDPSVKFEDVSFTSTYNQTDQTVTFAMTVSYRPIFSGLSGNIPIRTEVTFPYSVASGQQAGVPPPNPNEVCMTYLVDAWGKGRSAGVQYQMVLGSGGGDQLFDSMKSGTTGGESKTGPGMFAVKTRTARVTSDLGAGGMAEHMDSSGGNPCYASGSEYYSQLQSTFGEDELGTGDSEWGLPLY